MDPVLLSERRGRAQILTLNRPDKRNALNTELLRAFEAGFSAAAEDPEVATIVLTGADPAFCGGVDLGELEAGEAPQMGEPLRGVRKPVIGAVNGAAITGGLELALMCDLIVASELASFGDTHARVGLLPGWGQMTRLPAAVGTRAATQMLLTSGFLDAAQALALGLVNEVVAHERVLARALEIADAIAEADQPTVAAMLEQLRAGAGAPTAELLARERECAQAWQGAGFDTELIKAKKDS
jgi:enoyl-CoA hydratase